MTNERMKSAQEAPEKKPVLQLRITEVDNGYIITDESGGEYTRSRHTWVAVDAQDLGLQVRKLGIHIIAARAKMNEPKICPCRETRPCN